MKKLFSSNPHKFSNNKLKFISNLFQIKKQNKRKNSRDDSHHRQEVFLNMHNNFSFVEGYKAARTNLMFMSKNEGEGCPVVAFTSAVSGEGKTTSCVNMGISFGQAGMKTLIIDSDMRKPQIHNYFRVPFSPGLSDILGGLTDEINICESKYENVSILASGTIPPNPAELILSKSMDKLLEVLSKRFDFIFIDLPPVLAVTDATAMSSKINGLVVVVRQDYSRTDSIQEAMASLSQVGAKVLGIIYYCQSTQSKGYKRYSRYGYSRYGYSRDKSYRTYGETDANPDASLPRQK